MRIVLDISSDTAVEIKKLDTTGPSIYFHTGGFDGSNYISNVVSIHGTVEQLQALAAEINRAFPAGMEKAS